MDYCIKENIMTKFPNIEFYWWEDDNPLIQEIKKLSGIDISDPEEVHAAIEILEALDRNFYGLLLDHDIFFDENEIESILNLYRKSLNAFKKHEGVDKWEAEWALKSCLRLIQLLMGLLYDSFVGPGLPKAVRELI